MTTPYERFLESKAVLAPTCGFDVADSDLNPMLFPFQRDISFGIGASMREAPRNETRR